MRTVTGIWHIDRAGRALGTLLILLEELNIQRQIHAVDSVDLLIMGETGELTKDIPLEYDGPHASLARLLLPENGRLPPLLVALRSMSGLSNIFVYLDDDGRGCIESPFGADTVVWPDFEALKLGTHNYDSTRVVQAYHAQCGSIPRLSVTAELLGRAKAFLQASAKGRLPIAVHLKYNANLVGQSNADIDAWRAFVRDCHNAYPVHFVLVGDDASNARFRGMPNVTVACDHDFHIGGHLALIQASPVFMGMMSGPANMALLGENPYLIFKNPDHHAEEMQAELGDHDRYSFASPHQRVLRHWDSEDALHDAFGDLYREIAS